MRPDPHKQAASRKYHNKVRSRGDGATGAVTSAGVGIAGNSSATVTGQRGGRGARGGGARGGRGGRGGYRGRSNGNEEEDEGEDDGQDGDGAPRKSYARRKITSNVDRYIEQDEEATEAEELDQGIDRQTLAFKEMLKDSDQKKTFDPAAYFRFKSEKEVEAQDPMEESQQARKLLEIRLDDIEKALRSLTIKDRLYLRNSDVKALNRDVVGKVSLSTGKPIVPKLVRGQAASDILIKPSSATPGATIASGSYNRTAPGSMNASKQTAMDDEDDLDELLDITKTYGKTHPSSSSPLSAPPRTAAPPLAASNTSLNSSRATDSPTTGTKTRLSPPLSKGVRSTNATESATTTPSKGPPPLKKGPPRSAGGKHEEWLDSVLGM